MDRVKKTIIFMDKHIDCALAYTDFYIKEGERKNSL